MASARIVAFSSAKGGSGKTVTCASFARALAALDQRVLMIDADGDTSGMTLLFIDEVLRAKEQGPSGELSNGALGGLFEADGPTAFRPAPVAKNIDLLPTQYELASWIRGDDHTEARLEDVIRRFSTDYDYILLDAQAGADPAALGAATHADDVIIVSEYDPVSAQGVKRLEQLYPSVFSVSRTWILYNKVLPEIADSLGTLLRVEKRLSPIPWDAEVVRAYVSSEVPVDMDTPNAFTLAIVASLETLFRRRLADKLMEWRAATANALREPIDDRRKTLERELDSLERRRIELRTRANLYPRVRQLMTVTLASLGIAIAVAGVGATTVGAARWVVAALLGVGAVVLVALAPTLLIRQPARESEAELNLSRLERQTRILNDELRQLAISSSAVGASLGADIEASKQGNRE